ncbi:MAG: DUF4348 domain-containing protein [Bacteroidota bacterium]|jgi:hypothetical protein|nr:DUF4348 domain-containing protein [Bacteroidota bacterium]HHU97729.1 DUF4348 domain-containing protein [Petrimonas sp.]
MKINRFLFPLLFILLVLSCGQSRGDGRAKTVGDKAESALIAGAEVVSDTSFDAEEEEFDLFLQKFSEQRSFQLNRVKFPINVTVPDTDDEGMAPIEETIGRYEWEMLDFTYDSTFLTRPYDQYYQVVRFQNDTAVVEIRGINNGIYADYYFELIDNRWYLVTLCEASF